MKNLFLMILFLSPLVLSHAEDKELLKQRHGILINYWQELGLKAGFNIGYDLEFRNQKGHAVAVSVPQILLFNFPDNSFHFGLWSGINYRYIKPSDGFYYGMGMGMGWNVSWRTVPLYNLDGYQIKDTGFHQLLATAQLDFGYDFSIKFPKHPFRMFFTLGWKGLYPYNLNINSNIFMQLGFNVPLGKTK